MKLAKAFFDIGLTTDSIGPVEQFWRDEIGLRFNHVQILEAGHEQRRYDLYGSVLKLNSRKVDPGPSSGYHSLLIAREGVETQRPFVDPDGNKGELVPPGYLGVTQIGVRVRVRDLSLHRQFYGSVLGLPPFGENAYRVGTSVVLLEHDPMAKADGPLWGRGWRYLTVQIYDVLTEHSSILVQGGREGMRVRQLKRIARASTILDPDGNSIELSERADLTGSSLDDRLNEVELLD